jgi:hypothetical protein
VGSVVMSLAFDMPRHMRDQAAVLAGEAAQSPAPQPTAQAGTLATRSEGAVVLSDMVRVTNNIDSTQPLPADAAQQIMRHVVVQVRTGEAGAVVPYLGLSMDLLLDGRPVLNGQAVVPMVAMGSDAPRLYYGNNIRLPQRGTYQAFVRMSRNPLLGQDPTPAAQFNLAVR